MPRRGAAETRSQLRYRNGNAASAETAAGTGPSRGRGNVSGMTRRARDQDGPGTLTDDLILQQADQGALPDEPLAELAARYQLRPSAARPGVLAYAAQLWARRHFIMGFATARNVAMYTEARLGQLWQIITPLLNAAVYYLIFGIILDTSRGVPNFLAFLITGIFVFNFTQRAFITTSRVMPDSLPLIRALPFPRACLPIGYVLIELEQLVMSMVVLAVIVLASGEPLTWYWLLAIPALGLQTVFNVGMGLFLARLGAGADDFSQLLPFLVRTWMYASGVMYSIQTISFVRRHPTVGYLLQVNPAAVFIDLVRTAILQTQRLGWPGSKPYNAAACALYDLHGTHLENSAYCHGTVAMGQLWLFGAGWAVVAIVVGFVFFWEAETRYGRG
jgi:teichoic acid transport system permease protein